MFGQRLGTPPESQRELDAEVVLARSGDGLLRNLQASRRRGAPTQQCLGGKTQAPSLGHRGFLEDGRLGRERGGLLAPLPAQEGPGSDVEHGCPQGVAPGIGALSVQLFANPQQLAGCVVQRALAEVLPCRDRHQPGLEALQPGERALGSERHLPVAQSGGQPPGQQVRATQITAKESRKFNQGCTNCVRCRWAISESAVLE